MKTAEATIECVDCRKLIPDDELVECSECGFIVCRSCGIRQRTLLGPEPPAVCGFCREGR